MGENNYLGLQGISFVEFNGQNADYLDSLFMRFGFSKIKQHENKNITYYKQNNIHFFLNHDRQGYSTQFMKKHGGAVISSMGWLFKNPHQAHAMAIEKGAKDAPSDYKKSDGSAVPAIYGIGDSLIYFIDSETHLEGFENLGFITHPAQFKQMDFGFTEIDHLTNNVELGTMQKWASFYKDIFGFTEVRYFDIRGAQTGLTSYALKSPCGKFCIPINEAKESKSQINEYIEEYKGAGIQHLAFLTEDILTSLDKMKSGEIKTLDIDNEYYDQIFDKFPQVSENHEKIKKYNVLVDGDEHGYLLQIFTKNLIGPIFIEIIQRKNHYSFGEGNFGALFRSIERDQVKRGYLKT